MFRYVFNESLGKPEDTPIWSGSEDTLTISESDVYAVIEVDGPGKYNLELLNWRDDTGNILGRQNVTLLLAGTPPALAADDPVAPTSGKMLNAFALTFDKEIDADTADPNLLTFVLASDTATAVSVAFSFRGYGAMLIVEFPDDGGYSFTENLLFTAASGFIKGVTGSASEEFTFTIESAGPLQPTPL